MEDEKRLELPVTTYMLNLDKPDIMAKNETQFMKVIVRPLWMKLNELLKDGMKVATDNIDKNIQKWEEKANKAINEIKEESKADTS